MFAHQSHVKNLVDLVVWTPLVAHYVVSDGLHEVIVVVFPGSFVLDVRISIGGHSLGVV